MHILKCCSFQFWFCSDQDAEVSRDECCSHFSATASGPLISCKKFNLSLSCPVDVAVESVTLKEDKGEKAFRAQKV